MKELWTLAESLSHKMFKLTATSGSGRGYDKLDGKNSFFRVETKSTSKPSWTLKFSEFQKWRLLAAKDRKNFFMHIVPVVNEEIRPDLSMVIVDAQLFKHMLENQKDD